MAEVFSGNLTGAHIPSQQLPGVRFALERQLGRGGTATAYFGVRISPEGHAPVVVKIVHPELVVKAGTTASIVARKEFEALARVSGRIPPNPFVIRLYDAGSLAYRSAGAVLELPWLALEYVHGGVEGTTLEDRIDYAVRVTGTAFDCVRVARVVEHVCSGLDEVHAVGVIHRDLTPNNILCCGVGGAEVFKLSDFGIARSEGMEMTFGASVLGTPGYMPPEQLGVGEVGPASDVFALAALTYRALAGENYFSARTPIEALSQAQVPQRRSLLEAKTLPEELVADPERCRRIDAVLASATHGNPRERLGSGRVFAGALLPLLAGQATPCSVSLRPRAIPRLQAFAPDQRWMVRHPPGDDRVITSAAWDSDGHCLAATINGLELWDGATWHPAPEEQLALPRGSRCVFRVGPGRWLVAGERGTVAEYGGHGARAVFTAPDPNWRFTAVSGDPHDLCAFVAQGREGPPQLCACVGGRWLKPLAVPDASYVGGLARLDDERWVVAGRTRAGRGFASVFSPLHWELEPLAITDTRAYVAATGQHELGLALVVGVEGRVAEIENGHVRPVDLPEPIALSACAVDIVGRRWVGAAGALWVSGGDSGWLRGWQDPSWRAPFVSLYADVGLVVAMTATGGVLENRTSRSEISSAMARRLSAPP